MENGDEDCDNGDGLKGAACGAGERVGNGVENGGAEGALEGNEGAT